MKPHLLLFLLLASCTPQPQTHQNLIEFTVENKELSGLKEINKFRDRGAYGKPENLTTTYLEDTLTVTFDIFEDVANKISGDIEFSGDSLFLKIRQRHFLHEYTIHQFTYKIWNPEQKRYKVVISNDIGDTD